MRLAATLIVALLAFAPAAHAQELAPPFDEHYFVQDLGPPSGVPANLGGLTLKAGTTDRLLIGGAANGADGALYEIGLVRDAEGHITGFGGEITASSELGRGSTFRISLPAIRSKLKAG